jgi:hypothetical protein
VCWDDPYRTNWWYVPNIPNTIPRHLDISLVRNTPFLNRVTFVTCWDDCHPKRSYFVVTTPKIVVPHLGSILLDSTRVARLPIGPNRDKVSCFLLLVEGSTGRSSTLFSCRTIFSYRGFVRTPMEGRSNGIIYILL